MYSVEKQNCVYTHTHTTYMYGYMYCTCICMTYGAHGEYYYMYAVAMHNSTTTGSARNQLRNVAMKMEIYGKKMPHVAGSGCDHKGYAQVAVM